ncbi:DUF1684 domain-containing protein [Luteimonas sp. BDR2-5]|uniref:DUF1684 domain-containing protein n=1 Tax=Proluteimonas luteida TaxID=2878685 RepID=UPI001E44A9F5|nr:DUF1684 domain-containing protein [Luteimonas sp. BDR2-5]MCD9028313.1 DUF1684 domain-containing protein [Luteimonas sp. BDR2-5]
MRRLPTVAVLSMSLLLAGCGNDDAGAPDITGADADAPTVVPTSAEAGGNFEADTRAWRQTREARLREPDGWFSFAGSGQLSAGRHTVGSAARSAIRLPQGPDAWGVLTLADDGTLAFEPAPGSGVTVDGHPDGAATAVLRTQREEDGPTSVRFEGTRFYVVQTGDLHGWRFRDANSPSLRAFTGLDWFPADPQWRIEAEWVPFDPPRTLDLVSSIGTPEPGRSPGKAVFERDGRRHELQPIVEDEGGSLFFIFADRTSGRQTYGGARFLYADLPVDGRVVLDFNRAQNPPCALTPHVVCPMAPPGNRLDLAVEAGEKTYVDPAGAH